MVAGFFRNRRLFVYAFGVKLHLRDRRTDEETRLFVRPSVRSFVRSFVSLSVVSVTGVHPMGKQTAMLQLKK